jgi:hypothetical protein
MGVIPRAASAFAPPATRSAFVAAGSQAFAVPAPGAGNFARNEA